MPLACTYYLLLHAALECEREVYKSVFSSLSHFHGRTANKKKYLIGGCVHIQYLQTSIS